MAALFEVTTSNFVAAAAQVPWCLLHVAHCWAIAGAPGAQYQTSGGARDALLPSQVHLQVLLNADYEARYSILAALKPKAMTKRRMVSNSHNDG